MPFEPCGSRSGGSAAAIARCGRVESLELVEVDPLDVAADAAFGEAQRHPRLEAGDRARMHVGMRGKEVVEAVRPGVHQLPHRHRAARIIGLQLGLVT